jgi:uncharacterized protein YPO0396
MPFVGELIQVREQDRDWEGAAERLLRSFGLSLLVPDIHYQAVADWVDRNHLQGRLVYFHVQARRRAERQDLHEQSLVRKLALKPDSPFYPWLERELAHRFDVACCSTQEQFRREARAITRTGQIKDPSGRHEKDDRHRIDDRSRYVLGWSNTAKIAALETKLKHLNQRMCQVGEDYQRLKAEQTQLADRLRILARLDEFVDFQELDWGSVAREVEARVDERRCLAEASDVLRQLEARLKEAVQAQDQGERELAEARDKRSRLEQRLSDSSSQKAETLATLEAASGDPALAPRLEAWCAEALGQHVLSVESCDHREQELRTWLQGRIDAEQKKLERLAEKILKAMVAFNEEFKQDTAEIDASLEAAHEYQRLLDQLDQDDLPRFVARFKELLNINTINEIAKALSKNNMVKFFSWPILEV